MSGYIQSATQSGDTDMGSGVSSNVAQRSMGGGGKFASGGGIFNTQSKRSNTNNIEDKKTEVRNLCYKACEGSIPSFNTTDTKAYCDHCRKDNGTWGPQDVPLTSVSGSCTQFCDSSKGIDVSLYTRL